MCKFINKNYQKRKEDLIMADIIANNRDRASISSSMFTLWDVNGTQLRISAMDNGIMLGLWVPYFEASGARKYPQEQRYIVTLTQKNCYVLEEVIFNHILPAYAEGKNIIKGLYTNSARSSMIEIEVRDGQFFFIMHRNCDPTTRIAQNTFNFKFDAASMIEKYDRVSGEIEMTTIQADFYIFAKAIQGYNNMAAGTISGHGNKMISNYRNQQFMDYIRAIATAVHAQLPAPSYQYRGGYQDQLGVQNTYNPENINQQNTLPPTPQTIEVSSLTDLIS